MGWGVGGENQLILNITGLWSEVLTSISSLEAEY